MKKQCVLAAARRLCGKQMVYMLGTVIING